MVTSPRKNSWGVAHGVETVLIIASEIKLERPPGVVSYSAKRCLDGTEPEREHKGGTHFQRDLYKAGVCRRDFHKSSFCTIKYWRDLR